MIDIYEANPCLEIVAKLSVLLNRPKKSIISKLVKEGVYIRRGYRTKLGKIPITKLQILRTIEEVTNTKLPGLDKAPKSTLEILSTSVLEISDMLEEALGDLFKATELNSIRKEMNEN